MAKDNITPILEPAVNIDEVFLEQVRLFVERNDFVYMTGADVDVLVDKHSIPIFDIKPAEYGMISDQQLINSKTYLRFGVNTLKRLLYIIQEREHNDGENKKENTG